VGLRWWQPEQIEADVAGADQATNVYPFHEGLDNFATLRRYIGDFWFELRNIEAGFEQMVAEGGVYWTLLLWPTDGTTPPPGYLLGAGALTDNDRFIGFGSAPGELSFTSATGVKHYRFPSGGGPIHLDVHAQRRPAPNPGEEPWNPWLSWDFPGAGVSAFSSTTHVAIHARFGFLMERPT
jgi:hypothetical protein